MITKRRVEKLEATYNPTGPRVAFVQIQPDETEEQAIARVGGDPTFMFVFDLRLAHDG